MAALDLYAHPASDAARIGHLLGLDANLPRTDVDLADLIANGLMARAVTMLISILGRANVVGPLIPEATLRRAQTARKPLSREMSERLYEVSRVVDVVGRIYHGDTTLMTRFLTTAHPLLQGKTPLDLARSSSAGTDAVLNMLARAEAGFAV